MQSQDDRFVHLVNNETGTKDVVVTADMFNVGQDVAMNRVEKRRQIPDRGSLEKQKH